MLRQLILMYMIVTGLKLNFMTCIAVNDEPSGLTFSRCRLSDEQFDDCIRRGIRESIVFLSNDFTPLNITAIDPIYVKSCTMELSNDFPFILNSRTAIMEDMVIAGFKRAIVLSSVLFNTNVNETAIKFDVNIPYLYIETNYLGSGRVIVVPLEQRGKAYFEIKNLTVAVSIHGIHEYKDGEIFMTINVFDIQLATPQNFTMYFDNIFNNNFFGKFVNYYHNSVALKIFDDWRLMLQKEMGRTFKFVTSKIFNAFPLSTFIEY